MLDSSAEGPSIASASCGPCSGMDANGRGDLRRARQSLSTANRGQRRARSNAPMRRPMQSHDDRNESHIQADHSERRQIGDGAPWLCDKYSNDSRLMTIGPNGRPVPVVLPTRIALANGGDSHLAEFEHLYHCRRGICFRRDSCDMSLLVALGDLHFSRLASCRLTRVCSTPLARVRPRPRDQQRATRALPGNATATTLAGAVRVGVYLLPRVSRRFWWRVSTDLGEAGSSCRSASSGG